MPDIHDSIFPPTICNAWEDCNHDGVCHDPQTCGAIGPNAGEPGTQDDQTGNYGKSYSEKGQHVSGHAEQIVTAQPTAYRVVSEPSRSWHFARTRDDAEKIAGNLLKYANRCTDARIEPLYTSPSSDIPSEREVPQAIDPIISWMVTHGWLDADAEYSTADLLRALDDNYTEVGDAPQAQAVDGWRYEIQHGPEGETDYAWVYRGKEMICTTKTHHAIAIVSALTRPSTTVVQKTQPSGNSTTEAKPDADAAMFTNYLGCEIVSTDDIVEALRYFDSLALDNDKEQRK